MCGCIVPVHLTVPISFLPPFSHVAYSSIILYYVYIVGIYNIISLCCTLRYCRPQYYASNAVFFLIMFHS